eukprot:m.76617 g.76617  ORF g.76617 m.76617 type:complete len:102 (+) comp12568_c0_seq3:668-973(+)
MQMWFAFAEKLRNSIALVVANSHKNTARVNASGQIGKIIGYCVNKLQKKKETDPLNTEENDVESQVNALEENREQSTLEANEEQKGVQEPVDDGEYLEIKT